MKQTQTHLNSHEISIKTITNSVKLIKLRHNLFKKITQWHHIFFIAHTLNAFIWGLYLLTLSIFASQRLSKLLEQSKNFLKIGCIHCDLCTKMHYIDLIYVQNCASVVTRCIGTIVLYALSFCTEKKIVKNLRLTATNI